jgi:hypothetical protein
MKRTRIAKAIVISIAITFTSTAPFASAATKPKSAGRTSSTIPNTILNGKGAPLSSTGIDGDFYIDTRSLLIYGPKKNGKWPAPQNIQGPVGANGADGKNGNEGKTVSSASTIAGPTGAQGLQGEKGEKGDKGEPGVAGAAGANGSAGPAGPTGATGPQGATGSSGGGPAGPAGPTGATGATGPKGETGTAGTNGTNGSDGSQGLRGETGAAGTNGTNGTNGLPGPTGPKGDTGNVGAIGATGPSNVYVNTLTSWTLSSATKRSFSVSSLTPKFIAGKSYLYTIYIYGVSDANSEAFSLEILHEDNSTANFNYSVAFSKGLELDPKLYRYFFTVTGTFSPVSANSGIAIKIIDDMGVTSTDSMTFTGRIYSTLVGSIGAL